MTNNNNNINLKLKEIQIQKYFFFPHSFTIPHFLETCHIILSALDAIIYVSAVHYFQEFWA